MAHSEQAILRSELRWGLVVGGIVAVILGAILFAALSMHINPPSNREFIDPKTLHRSAEFTESIRRSGSPVVHCPRSNLRLRCGRMPLEKLINLVNNGYSSRGFP